MPSLPRSPFGRRAARSRIAEPGAAERETPHVDIVEAPGLRWINIERPRAIDRAWLEERFEFHALDYEDIFSRNQRPKVDEYDDYLFCVLHSPRYDKAVSRLTAAELDLFVGPDFLITLPNEPLQPLDYLFESCRTNEELRDELFSKGPGYLLYKIVDDCVDASFPMLRKIGNKLERIEEDIFEGRADEVVRDISNAKQEIINFRKVIRPQRAAFADLERNKQRYIAEDLDIYFDDIVDASERIWDMLENYKEVVEALEDTNESAIAHRSGRGGRRATARADRALHVADHPVVRAGEVEGRLVRAVQRADGHQVAGRPLGDVALGVRVDTPAALEQRVGLARGVAVEPHERGEHLGAADGGRRGEEVGQPLGPDEHRERVVALRPRPAHEAVGVREAARAHLPPDGIGEGGDDLGGERLALAVQAGQPRVRHAGDRNVAQWADGQRADDRLGAQLLPARERDRRDGADVDRDDVRPEAQAVAQPRRHGQRQRPPALPQPPPP